MPENYCLVLAHHLEFSYGEDSFGPRDFFQHFSSQWKTEKIMTNDFLTVQCWVKRSLVKYEGK